MIIRESESSNKNKAEKEQYVSLLKKAALGLSKNYKSSSQKTRDSTHNFQVKIAENFDGSTFAVFLKHLNDLKKDVLEFRETEGLKIDADDFLIFLDKLKVLTHSKDLNEMIMSRISEVNIDMLSTKALLNTY